MQISTIGVATEAMTGPRVYHAIARLTNSLILICGGQDASGDVLDTAEIFDEATGVSVAVGDMVVPRYGHTATLLTDGRVLIAGGQTTGGVYVASAEYFKLTAGMPAAGSFVSALTGLTSARAGHCAVLTANGFVLVTGGANGSNAALALTELYVPALPTEMAGIGAF